MSENIVNANHWQNRVVVPSVDMVSALLRLSSFNVVGVGGMVVIIGASSSILIIAAVVGFVGLDLLVLWCFGGFKHL